MAVPKKKISKSRRNMRRSHLALSQLLSIYGKCNNCGWFIIRHQACGSCGHYNGRKIHGVTNIQDLQKRSKLRAEKKAAEDTGGAVRES